MRSTLFLLFLVPSFISAQVAETVTVRLALGDPQTPDGLHAITVHWYDVPTGGSSLSQEDHTIDLRDGECTVVLGTVSPLPLSVMERGVAYLGVRVDGTPERTPRIQLAPQAFARVAAFAEVAERLSPSVTGIVTSINEIAGNVKVHAGNGIRITRSGSVLLVEGDSAVAERGTISGTGSEFIFTVQPNTILRSEHDVTFCVAAGTTTIAVGCTINLNTNTMVFVTSAPLLTTEQIRWEIRR